MQRIKCVVVGDSGVGKSALLETYTTNNFPTRSTSTLTANGRSVQVALHDTSGIVSGSGASTFARLRNLSYVRVNVVLLCFSVDCRPSFNHIRKVWEREIEQQCPHVPKILVATKIDLRDDRATQRRMHKQGHKPIQIEEGAKLAKQLGAGYIETSALNKEGLKKVFDAAIVAGYLKKKQRLSSKITESSEKVLVRYRIAAQKKMLPKKVLFDLRTSSQRLATRLTRGSNHNSNNNNNTTTTTTTSTK